MNGSNYICHACGKDAPQNGEKYCPHCISVLDRMFPENSWRDMSEDKLDECIRSNTELFGTAPEAQPQVSANIRMGGNMADIYCTTCGAPAKYDIISGQYLCENCGGSVSINAALEQKKGFREFCAAKLNNNVKKYKLEQAKCSYCGAKLIFGEGEAMTNCSFCDHTLVRKNYLSSKNMPELIIPFRITQQEAAERISEWCSKNSGKREAKHLKAEIGELKGFYLPYELVRGPVSCKVSRISGGSTYTCRGYVDNVFVNCSKQLDNRLLDGMEPYELDELKEFDFAYTAGQRIKTGDIIDKDLKFRVAAEVSDDYEPTVRKTLESKALNIETDVSSILRMPVLLPVYYILAGKTVAAVNGQTGKVGVRAEKKSHYYFIPWWLKAILATLIITGGAFGAFCFFAMEVMAALYIAGMLGAIMLLITLTVYSDTDRTQFKIEAEQKIFKSSGGPFRRVDSALVQDKTEITKKVTPPVFMREIEGKQRPVKLVFTSPKRVAKLIRTGIVTMFLPVITALFINGFDFKRLDLRGSAMWLLISVIIVPTYILKFGIVQLYERPWVYLISEKGDLKRYKKKKDNDTKMSVVKDIIAPPGCLIVIFVFAMFCFMVYATAFGLDSL